MILTMSIFKYTGIKEMKNISPNVYTTPNNHFFSKADSLDLNENNLVMTLVSLAP